MQLMGKRSIELLALTMVGDGLLTAVEPRRHLGLGSQGPRRWRTMTGAFLERPGLSRVLGVLSVCAGLFIASRLRT